MRAKQILCVLVTINLLNYIDRWIIAAIVPAMQKDLGLSNTTAGFIMSGFMLGYFITSPLFGYLTDRMNRIKLLMVGTGLWGVATALSGFGQTATQIFFARSVVGVGEASNVSAAPSLIADLFPSAKLNQAMAFFTAAIPVGSALGFVLGGLIENHWGWRGAFFMAAVPGILMVVLLMFVKEPKRGMQEPQVLIEPSKPTSFFIDVKKLVKNKTYLNAVLGYAAFTFTVGGFASWAPKYLVTVRSVPLAQADTVFGALTVVAGFTGSILGGYGAAWLLKKKKSGDIWFAVLAMGVSIPFAFLSFILTSKWAFYSTIGLCEFFLFMSQPPITVVTLESVSPLLRGTSSALCVFTIHLLGDFISPPLIGFMADKFSLKEAIFLSPLALFLGFFFYWRSYKCALRHAPLAEPI